MAMRRMRRSSRRSRPFRRSVVRKSGFRKRKFVTGAPGRHDPSISSSLLNPGAWDYKRKRFNPRAQRRKLVAASNASSKHRSVQSVTGTAVSAIALGTQNVFFRAAIEDAGAGFRFWETLGGLVTQDGDSVTTAFGGGDLFIRGGKVIHSFYNNGTVSVKLRTWEARTTKNGGIPSNPAGAVTGWDPSYPLGASEDASRLYRFFKEITVILKPGESWERTTFVRAQKVDQTLWIANQDRDFFIYSLENLQSIVATSLQVVSAYNLTFTGDRTI